MDAVDVQVNYPVRLDGHSRDQAIGRYLRQTECEPATVNWLLIAAKGCFFHSIHEEDVPKPEAAVAESHYTYGNFTDLVHRICTQAALGNGPQSNFIGRGAASASTPAPSWCWPPPACRLRSR